MADGNFIIKYNSNDDMLTITETNLNIEIKLPYGEFQELMVKAAEIRKRVYGLKEIEK